MPTWKQLNNQRWLFIMLIPCILFVFVFSYMPLKGLYMAFIDYVPGLPVKDAEFVGLRYFRMFFNSTDFGKVMRNTLVLNFAQLILGPVFSIVLAVALSEIRFYKFKRFTQTVSYLPYFISWVIASTILKSLFTVDDGFVNVVLMKLGFIDQNIPFLTIGSNFWPTVTLAQLWKGFGWGSILYLAAITSISSEMFEAAEIDGCSRWKKIWFIVLPCLIPTIAVLLIMNSGWILNGFDPYFLLSNPATREWAEVVDTYVFRYGLQRMNYSYATAVGLMKTVVGLVMITLVNQLSKKVTDFELL